MTSDYNKVIVVGDVHGDLNQFIYPLIYFMNDIDNSKIIYLGDYIDRGESNVYIYEILNALNNIPEFKNKIVFLRGNHESFDSGTYDYMHTDIEEMLSSDSRIKSFMFDKFFDMDLDIFHYDEDNNLLYTHSPTSKDLEYVLSLNEHKHDERVKVDNTFTDDREHKKMTYGNIHGHDHNMSSLKRIKEVLNGTKHMASLDCDASYGITLVHNAYKKTNRWTSELASEVTYLVMYCDKRTGKIINTENNCELITDRVLYMHLKDLNTKSFEYIKNYLIENNKNPILHNCFKELNLESSFRQFKKVYNNMFRDDPDMVNVLNNISNLYHINIKNKNSVNIYFHDVPIELYQMIGLFSDMIYLCIYKLYWYCILKNEFILKYIDRRYKHDDDYTASFAKRSGGNNINIIKLILIVYVVTLLITIIYVISFNANYNNNVTVDVK